MKIKLTILLCLITSSFFAQKSTEKIWSADAIKSIKINGDNIFKIKVDNNFSNTISLKVKIEGEHADQLVVFDSIADNILVISSSYQPLFVKDNDKLSAHKVVSIEYVLTVPNHVILDVKSNIGSVKINGSYPSVFVELYQGNCSLKQFFGDASINTIDGNISIETNNAIVKAFTKTGTKNISDSKYGLHTISCHSINGNIMVTKIKN